MNKLAITVTVTLTLITGSLSVNAASCKSRVKRMQNVFCSKSHAGCYPNTKNVALCKYINKKSGKIEQDCKRGDNLRNIMRIRVPSQSTVIERCFEASAGANFNSCCGGSMEKY